jgi:plasmid stabilization system protein ParE
MEQYKVEILDTAINDLSEIIDYLNTMSPTAAFRYYDLLTGKIDSLSVMPERCPVARDIQLRLRGYRFLAVENYLVFFVITANIVQVRRILYGRRQYENLL